MENKEELVSRVQDFFKQKGVEVSYEDAESILNFADLGKQGKLEGKDKVVYDYLSNENAELSDEDLEAIAGGQGIFGWIVDVVSTPFRALGTAIGGALAGIATPFKALDGALAGRNVGAELKDLWGGLIDFMWGSFGK